MEVYLQSTGSHLPARRVANTDLPFHASTLGLIAAKTGVEARFHTEEGESTSDLAIAAARKCLNNGSVAADEVDAVILATSTPDRLIPATATKVAAALGARRAFAFDLNSVCSSSVYVLEVARSLIAGGAARNVLAIAADTYSKFLNPEDFSTYPYFGDGAGAALLSREKGGAGRLGKGSLYSDGDGYGLVTIKGGGSELPRRMIVSEKDAFFSMNGRAVFEFATRVATESITKLFEEGAASRGEVVQVILHQANINIIKKVAADLSLPEGLFFTNLERYGNTAGASVLIALDEFLTGSTRGQNGVVVLCSFGGGLSWGTIPLHLEGV